MAQFMALIFALLHISSCFLLLPQEQFMGSNTTLLLQKLHLQSPLWWFIEELGWHKHYTPTTTTAPNTQIQKNTSTRRPCLPCFLGLSPSIFLAAGHSNSTSEVQEPSSALPSSSFYIISIRTGTLHHPTTNPRPSIIFIVDGSGTPDGKEEETAGQQWQWQRKGQGSHVTRMTTTKEGKKKLQDEDNNNDGG